MTRDELIAEYRKRHEGDQFRGLTLATYKRSVAKVITRFGCKTVLDYGSGKGEVWPAWAGEFNLSGVRCYDPAVPQFEAAPEGRFDLVVCCDVLEHLLEADAEDAVRALFAHAERAVWASVCCRPAKKSFDDGTNMHVTVRPIAWWRDRFGAAAARAGGTPFLLVETP